MSWAEVKNIKDELNRIASENTEQLDRIEENLIKARTLIYTVVEDTSITTVNYYDSSETLLGTANVVDGVAKFYTDFSGRVVVKAGTYHSYIDITVYKTYYTKLSAHKNFGFRVTKEVSDPYARVTYLEDAIGYTPAHMDYTSGVFNYGSWKDAFFMPKPCMLNYDGTVAYFLNKDDYTRREDGTNSDIANTAFTGNAMMQFPKIWHRVYEDATYEYHYIANYKVNDSYECYANLDYSGKEIPYFYTPIYNGSVVDNRLRSLSGRAPINSNTGSAEINFATANNSNGVQEWYIEQWCDRDLIVDLLKLISKSTDSQTVFGRGYDTGGSSAASLMNSGSMNTKGLFWGTNTGTDGVKVFGMEHFWGNQFRRTAGLLASGTRQYVKKTWSTADGSSVTGYQQTSVTGYRDTGVNSGGTSGGFCSVTKASELGTLNGTMNGSSSTYECDGDWFGAGSGVFFALVGGYCNAGLLCGAGCVGLGNAVSISAWDFGAALSCKPKAA